MKTMAPGSHHHYTGGAVTAALASHGAREDESRRFLSPLRTVGGSGGGGPVGWGAPWQSPPQDQRRDSSPVRTSKHESRGQDGAASGQVPVLVLLIRPLQVLLLYEHVDRFLRRAEKETGLVLASLILKCVIHRS